MGRDDMSEAQKQFEEAVRKFAVYMFNTILITQTRKKLVILGVFLQSVLLNIIEKKKKRKKILVVVLQNQKTKYGCPLLFKCVSARLLTNFKVNLFVNIHSSKYSTVYVFLVCGLSIKKKETGNP